MPCDQLPVFGSTFSVSQYTEETDPELAVIVRRAQDFLLEKEQGLGKGLFVDSTDNKDRYHAGYCAVVGLLESHFALVSLIHNIGS